MISINLRLDAPPQKFLHTTERGPGKVFSIGPALANAGPDYAV